MSPKQRKSENCGCINVLCWKFYKSVFLNVFGDLESNYFKDDFLTIMYFICVVFNEKLILKRKILLIV